MLNISKPSLDGIIFDGPVNRRRWFRPKKCWISSPEVLLKFS